MKCGEPIILYSRNNNDLIWKCDDPFLVAIDDACVNSSKTQVTIFDGCLEVALRITDIRFM